jgi:hypothetical protein
MILRPEKVKKSGTLPLPPDKATQPQSGPLLTLVMDQSTHENLDRDEPNSPGSDRTFGLVMAAADRQPDRDGALVLRHDLAGRCFMGNELNLLVVGRCVLKKAEQNPALRQDYSSAFELD